jgi:hypothetical protein
MWQQSDLDERVARRFWARVKIIEGDCWEWLGSISPKGRAEFSIRTKHVDGHVVAYLLLVGEIPEGFDVHHACDNKPCTNPEHLTLIPHGEHSRITQYARWRMVAMHPTRTL